MNSVDTISDRIEEVLTLDVPAGLPRHRLWNLIITPYKCQNGRLSVLGDDDLSESLRTLIRDFSRNFFKGEKFLQLAQNRYSISLHT